MSGHDHDHEHGQGRPQGHGHGHGEGGYEEGTDPAVNAASAANIEYRIAALEARLAAGALGELGMRVESRGAVVTVTGTVPTAQCREELLGAVHEELAGLAVHTDIHVAEVAPPDHAEDLT
jgi:hypothetical protein